MAIGAQRIFLSPPLRRSLCALSRSRTVAVRAAERSRMILLAAQGLPNAEIARRLHLSEDSVRKWRGRFAAKPILDSLNDKPRCGRPSRISVSDRCGIVKIACAPPKDFGHEFRELWSLNSLRDSINRHLSLEISRSEVNRILSAADIRPHKVKMWLHSPDPEFKAKSQKICALYLDPPVGTTVLCVDEKTGMQALGRASPLQLACSGKNGRMEYEYKRNGTRSLIASFEPKTGKVIGYCAPRRTADDLMAFMEHLASQYPKGMIHVIWDNLNIHYGNRWIAFNMRHGNRFRFSFTPYHASWMNQIEIWFGILQRRILRYGDFTSADDLTKKVLKFIQHWNKKEAHPFQWLFRGKSHQSKAA